MPLPPATPRRTPLVQGALDLSPPVAHFRRPHDLSARIVDQGEAGGLATWIDLDAQLLKLRSLHRTLEDQRERVAPIDRRFTLLQEQAGTPRRHGVERLLVCIKDQHL
jgi:hypothetical protein